MKNQRVPDFMESVKDVSEAKCGTFGIGSKIKFALQSHFTLDTQFVP